MEKFSIWKKIHYWISGIVNTGLSNIINFFTPEPPKTKQCVSKTEKYKPASMEFGFSQYIQDIYSEEDLIKTLNFIEKNGGKWLRTEFPYKNFKKNLELMDRIVKECKKREINLIPVLGSWITNSKIPTDMQDYLKYVEIIVERYKGNIKVYEIWNEPNLVTFWRSSIKQYSYLLKETCKKIKNIDKNILTAISFSWQYYPRRLSHFTFLEKLSEDRALDCVDIIGIHGYPGVWEPPEPWEKRVLKVKSFLENLGYKNKQLWITEFGYVGFSPEKQIKFLETAIKSIKKTKQVPVAIWFSLRDSPAYCFYQLRSEETNFGLLDRNFKPKNQKLTDTLKKVK